MEAGELMQRVSLKAAESVEGIPFDRAHRFPTRRRAHVIRALTHALACRMERMLSAMDAPRLSRLEP